jgi:hypothetical protein
MCGIVGYIGEEHPALPINGAATAGKKAIIDAYMMART